MRLRVERTGGIAAFANPLGGEVEVGELPEPLAREARDALTPDRLRERGRSAPKRRSGARVDGETITVRVSEGDESHEFAINDDDPDVDLFDLCNAIVNELVRSQIAEGTSGEASESNPNEEPASGRTYDAIFFDIGSTLVSAEHWVEGAAAALAKLGARGIPMGVISNTGNLTRDQVLDLLPADFDFNRFEPELVLLSSEVQIEKPDPRIFSLAAKRAGVKPSRCLFCGEDLTETMVAQQVGLHAIRLGANTGADFAALIEIVDA